MQLTECYQILELQRDATLEDIKKSYKRLAYLYHPDKNPTKESEEKFKKINEAYDSLIKNPPKTDTPNKIFQDLFNEFFYNKSSIFTKKIINVSITLEEALKGTTKNLKIYNDKPCSCSIVFRAQCPYCKGLGYIKESKGVTVNIPAGVVPGQIFIVDTVDSGLKLHIRIEILSTKKFKIRGNHILSEESVNIFKAILGGRIRIQTILGEEEIDLPQYMGSEYKQVLKGRGLSGGDHYVFFKIFIPELDEKQLKLLRVLLNES